ncbi:tRNA (adenosine(37)-N6)-threonylcarbamoyltransferase complex ATPase subunit type 1 TsaE [Robiginitalea sp. SC105]|uniref:tRNA (adenosine(37)-N6)-threonylcarbamoyltransferase complex ATPase subunit type 1 TsaE n=1 Tax=Robiginitalea sp. SC105 TaxID=2762332 RepID=UPI00163B302B|nr:tRNA (adenosine(37)-N6)-threonylcarbamoyltransferase complex ATPase subunit type 1 TsaE [Robiginitalea sp. SC105]MBC2840618.1 tRNA (adenosine(37)-N6)-threonylcarbamoyltransferase complex ATPase subunit type 1 TsaE [Robiginitalea sp. SC105]
MAEQLIYKLSKIDEVASKVMASKDPGIVCLRGPMGSGKTTLVKHCLKFLGIKDSGNSPTFGIVNEYSNNNVIAYHLDCYRLKTEEEALDFGIEEYLDSDKWVFIEWPSIIETLLPENRIEINIEILENSSRKLLLSQL